MTSSKEPHARLLAVALIIVMAGCGDYAHANPFDPGVEVRLTVSGTDSVHALKDTLRMTLATDPVYPHEAPTWQAESPNDLRVVHIGQGRFVVTNDDATNAVAPRAVTIVAVLGANRVATKTVGLLRHPRSLAVTGSDGQRGARTLAVGGTVTLSASLLDRGGDVVRRQLPRTLTVRDPAVVTVRANVAEPAERFDVTGVARGSTWVVAAALGFADSVLVTVP